jgi:hypothetical protein
VLNEFPFKTIIIFYTPTRIVVPTIMDKDISVVQKLLIRLFSFSVLSV